MKKKPAQLQREIDEALHKRNVAVLRQARTDPRAHEPAIDALLERGYSLERARKAVKPYSPKRRKVGHVGDVNPIDYGGGYVVSDANGTHLEYFAGLDGDERAEKLSYADDGDEKIDTLKVKLYSVDLGKDARDFLSNHDWIDWAGIANYTGQDAAAYAADALRSAQARADAIYDAASYHGWDNFDSDPARLTVGDLREMWKRW
jgi:hypothetical protein